MKNIVIIAGDSWGYGEWSESDPHIGLAQYLAEDGYIVINLSKAGGSNFDSWIRLDNFLASNNYHWGNIAKIFVFQTEWDRELTLNDEPIINKVTNISSLLRGVGFVYIDANKSVEEQLHLKTANSLGALLMSNFYSQLNRIGSKHNVKIDLIGGCTDVMTAELFGEKYPNVRVACQSVVNLLVNDNPNIDTPIDTLFQRPAVIDFIKKHLSNNSELSELLNLISISQLRYKVWGEHKEWFFPDGGHANRAGHRKLYEYLKQNW